eukprot:2536851-Rhodomonas_salina.1
MEQEETAAVEQMTPGVELDKTAGVEREPTAEVERDLLVQVVMDHQMATIQMTVRAVAVVMTGTTMAKRS